MLFSILKCIKNLQYRKTIHVCRDVIYLKLGGAQHYEGTFFLKKVGTFSTDENSTSLLIAKSRGHVPPVPPSSYIYACVTVVSQENRKTQVPIKFALCE